MWRRLSLTVPEMVVTPANLFGRRDMNANQTKILLNLKAILEALTCDDPSKFALWYRNKPEAGIGSTTGDIYRMDRCLVYTISEETQMIADWMKTPVFRNVLSSHSNMYIYIYKAKTRAITYIYIYITQVKERQGQSDKHICCVAKAVVCRKKNF